MIFSVMMILVYITVQKIPAKIFARNFCQDFAKEKLTHPHGYASYNNRAVFWAFWTVWKNLKLFSNTPLQADRNCGTICGVLRDKGVRQGTQQGQRQRKD